MFKKSESKLLCLLPLMLLLASCTPPTYPYQSGGFTVTFPAAFQTDQSDDDTPEGKVHKAAAICTHSSGDFAFLTTTYPPGLILSNSSSQILQKELDLDIKRMGTKLSSSQLDINSPIPSLKFTFEIMTQKNSHGEGRLFFRSNQTFLVSVLYANPTRETRQFMSSVKLPAR